jgi:hypothetical protein
VRDAFRDLRETLRSVQDYRLDSLIETEMEGREREELEEEQRSDIQSLLSLSRSFLQVMKANGNPGIEQFSETELVSRARWNRPPSYRVVNRGPKGWTMAQRVPNPYRPEDSIQVILLTEKGQWWRGSGPPESLPDAASYVIEQIDPLAFIGRSDFTSFGGEPRLATEHDFYTAVIGSIATYADRYDLQEAFDFG